MVCRQGILFPPISLDPGSGSRTEALNQIGIPDPIDRVTTDVLAGITDDAMNAGVEAHFEGAGGALAGGKIRNTNGYYGKSGGKKENSGQKRRNQPGFGIHNISDAGASRSGLLKQRQYTFFEPISQELEVIPEFSVLRLQFYTHLGGGRAYGQINFPVSGGSDFNLD